MNWLLIAVLGYFLGSIGFILDKFILKKGVIPEASIFATYVGISGIYALFLIPFGFSINIPISVILLSVFSGFIFIINLFFYYKAAQLEEISRIAPLMGILSSVFVLLLSGWLSIEKLVGLNLWAFFFLIFGGTLIAFKKTNWRASLKIFLFIFLAAFLSAVAWILIKAAYLQTTFLNAYILGRGGEFLAALFLLVLPDIRKAVFEHLKQVKIKTVGLFVSSKFLGATFFILLNYAIFLGSVNLVQALQGLQYVFLLILAVFLSWKFSWILKEEISGVIFKKIAGVILISAGLFFLYLGQDNSLFPGVKSYGVTFSYSWADNLGLNPRETYLAILDDLKVKQIRLPFYWSEIEKIEGKYNFDNFDWQVVGAEKKGVRIIAAIGYKLPRWPECHIPRWTSGENSNFQTKILNYLRTTVERYKNSQAIWAWQVENEPFLPFGECPKLDMELLDKEIALVRSLDRRPIIITESGELSSWHRGAKKADILGTTMYRIIWNPSIPFGGYLKYPLPPVFFQLKANLVKIFAPIKKIIVVELQAEPWGPKQLYETPLDRQLAHFDFEQFKNNISYAQKVGFQDVYFWGAEWWYWLKTKQNHPEFWDYIKKYI